MSVDPVWNPGSGSGTAANQDPGAAAPSRPSRACRVGLLGFGTIGQAVARSLCERPRAGLRLTHILSGGGSRQKPAWLPADVCWTPEIYDILLSDVDVVVDLSPDDDQAFDGIRSALEAGKSVVTASRDVVARRGPELLALARARGCQFRFEAAVGGPVPMVAGLRDGLAGDRVRSLVGILNGACNYVLNRIEWTGGAFADALAEATRLGLVSENPDDDVEGHDAAAKLSVLCGIAFGRQILVDEVPRQSIAPIAAIDFQYAARLDCTIRPVACAERGSRGLTAWVAPALVPRGSMLAHLHGSQNILIATGEATTQTGFFGVGAGGRATAVAVVSDLVGLACMQPRFEGGLPVPMRAHVVTADAESRRYVRFVVRDRPGIIAELATVFASEGVSVEAVLQEPPLRGTELPFVITLDPCRQAAFDRALDRIAACDFHVRPPLGLRMLDPAMV
ncbi:MAG: homoserine dehydrogenase [Acidobacteriota bacterium]|nr:homoserine dehydrogenase [Acidobacteriota bacterium]